MEFCGSHRAAYEKLSDDVPFELPKSWMWCRLGEIAEVQLGKMLDRKKTNGTPLPYLANVSVRWGELDLLALKTMPFSECEKEKFALRPGDILMCEGGVPGRCAIWREPDSIIKYQKALHRIRLKTVSAEYIRYFFEAIHDTMFFTKRFSGSTIHHLPREVLIQVPIPLPPLTEQKRIVASIEELFKIADRLGEAADGLETAAKHLDKKILDLAIRGKLLPQNSKDETASELLKRIAATSHKSPCKNHETPIEPPFAIPESWEWAKLGEIISLLSGRDLSPSDYSSFVNQFPYITGASNFVDGRLVVNRWTDKAITISHNGDLLITCKGTIGAMAINNIGDIHIARQIMAISSSGMDLKFIKIFLESAISTLKDSATSMIPGIDRNTVLSLLIPVPPLSEQKRIVTRVQEARDILALLFP